MNFSDFRKYHVTVVYADFDSVYFVRVVNDSMLCVLLRVLAIDGKVLSFHQRELCGKEPLEGCFFAWRYFCPRTKLRFL